MLYLLYPSRTRALLSVLKTHDGEGGSDWITTMNLCPARGAVCRATPPYGVTNVADVSGLRLLAPSRATARPGGVDFGRAWLTLEHVRVLGLRADADAAVAVCVCT